MATTFTFLAIVFFGGAVADRFVRPWSDKLIPLGGRSAAGLWLLCMMTAGMFGFFLLLCGNALGSAILTLALATLFTVVSNSKFAVLGEPLLFSDLALIPAVFRHPQFYLSAVKTWIRVTIIIAAGGLVATFYCLFVADFFTHIAGGVIALLSSVVLMLTLRSKTFQALAREPSAHADIMRHGLLPTMLLYWSRWRASPTPAPSANFDRLIPSEHPERPELAIVIQCESFADPVELFGDEGLELEGLAAARHNAWQWGQLAVSGFGAYTMRTEYGVLFGRSEAELGFRRYDPFLTALEEVSHALPAKLQKAGWVSHFMHPHDMRFYNRDRIMPASGFAELIGIDHFTPPPSGTGRYVSDAAVAAKIISMVEKASSPTLIYAVTIENHGPWEAAGKVGHDKLEPDYLELVRRSDAMLSSLLDQLAEMARPAMLVFFGDHRPSIPGLTVADHPRHTPYVVVRTDSSGRIASGENRNVNLTPAELHHHILDSLMGQPIPDGSEEEDIKA